MHRDAAYHEYLEHRYEYANWKSAPLGDAEPELSLPDFSGDELPGWSLQRASLARQPDGTMAVRGFWVADDDAGRVLDVEVFDCAGTCGAREYVLTLLGDMQGARAEREPAESLGDVAFRIGGDTAVLFARRNLVIRIRNAGSAATSGMPTARRLDHRLIAHHA